MKKVTINLSDIKTATRVLNMRNEQEQTARLQNAIDAFINHYLFSLERRGNDIATKLINGKTTTMVDREELNSVVWIAYLENCSDIILVPVWYRKRKNSIAESDVFGYAFVGHVQRLYTALNAVFNVNRRTSFKTEYFSTFVVKTDSAGKEYYDEIIERSNVSTLSKRVNVSDVLDNENFKWFSMTLQETTADKYNFYMGLLYDRIDGKTYTQIAQEKGFTKFKISYCFDKMRKVWNDVNAPTKSAVKSAGGQAQAMPKSAQAMPKSADSSYIGYTAPERLSNWNDDYNKYFVSVECYHGHNAVSNWYGDYNEFFVGVSCLYVSPEKVSNWNDDYNSCFLVNMVAPAMPTKKAFPIIWAEKTRADKFSKIEQAQADKRAENAIEAEANIYKNSYNNHVSHIDRRYNSCLQYETLSDESRYNVWNAKQEHAYWEALHDYLNSHWERGDYNAYFVGAHVWNIPFFRM